VPVPQRVIFAPLAANEMPRSKTFVFSEAWRQDGGTAEPVAGIVERWRHRQKMSGARPSRRAEATQRAQAQAAAGNGAVVPSAASVQSPLRTPFQVPRPTGT
jgi:hypothetical protein